MRKRVQDSQGRKTTEAKKEERKKKRFFATDPRVLNVSPIKYDPLRIGQIGSKERINSFWDLV